MKYILILFLTILSSCTHNQTKDAKIAVPAAVDKKNPYLVEEFTVVRSCYNMVIESIDYCDKAKDTCYGAVHPTGSSEHTYAKIHYGKRPKDTFQYCYLHEKENHSLLDSYFIYDNKNKK